jgi:arylsulfatase A-like enzyme
VPLLAGGYAIAQHQKPTILVVLGDDLGQSAVSAYTRGVMGVRMPNIDRIVGDGMMFTNHYAEQSCTAGRSSFITGQATPRTGLSKVGLPGADPGLRKEGIPIAEVLKPLGHATDQLGKNDLGDHNEFLRPCTASTSSLAIFTTSTPRRSRRTRTTPRSWRSGPVRAARRAQVHSARHRRSDTTSPWVRGLHLEKVFEELHKPGAAEPNHNAWCEPAPLSSIRATKFDARTLCREAAR